MVKLLFVLLLCNIQGFCQFNGRETDTHMLQRKVFDSLRLEYIHITDIADATKRHFDSSQQMTHQKMKAAFEVIKCFVKDSQTPDNARQLFDNYWIQYNEYNFKEQVIESYFNYMRGCRAAICQLMLYGGSLAHVKPAFEDYRFFVNVRRKQMLKIFDEHETKSPDKTRHGEL